MRSAPSGISRAVQPDFPGLQPRPPGPTGPGGRQLLLGKPERAEGHFHVATAPDRADSDGFSGSNEDRSRPPEALAAAVAHVSERRSRHLSMTLVRQVGGQRRYHELRSALGPVLGCQPIHLLQRGGAET